MKKRFFALIMALVFVLSLVPANVFASATAEPSAHSVRVDGQAVEIGAYNISGHNYFMLRDVAHVLKDTEAKFDVGWDAARNAILLTTKTSYVQGGGAALAVGRQMAVPSTAVVYVDGVNANLRAYNINGHNYFMLRDLGDVIGFRVDWDASANAVLIDTTAITQVPLPTIAPTGTPVPTATPTASPAVTPAPTVAPTTAPATSGGFNAITATEWNSRIVLGWNLGNTLDSHGNSRTGFSWLGGGSYANTSVAQMETAWVNTVASRQLVDAVAAAGFNAIRIPVTWYKVADSDYNIREDWMARVRQVVDYAVANDMYIMLNSHHDEYIFDLNNPNMAESRRAIERIWTQIANEFEGYNERLVFEGLNEPRTKGTPAEWNGGTAEERNNLNILNQLFVDTVRATGGNNAERVLVVPTYGASPLDVAMRALVVPTDTVSDRIIVSIHFYEPYNFALNTGDGAVSAWNRNNSGDTNPITSRIDRAHNLFVSRGVPVVIGEMGAMYRGGNNAARAEWAEFYVGYARSKNIPCFWWDNGGHAASTGNESFGLFNRSNAQLIHPETVAALLRGARGN
ncbi:MAG: cellulase family glycosylhydrolase [Clostridiales bacterium]|jgi:endoglucanase|nr:cellulase family glycosylhydrolase [Clostridiales bacterium]